MWEFDCVVEGVFHSRKEVKCVSLRDFKNCTLGMKLQSTKEQHESWL